jgi:DNA-binding Lrp family transcriptional regulator
MMQFACDLGHVQDVGRALAARDDVRFVALVTGPFDVVVEMVAPSNRDLARVILEQLPAVPGITRSTTETELRNFKTAYDWSYDLLGDGAAALPHWPRAATMASSPPSLDEVDACLLARLKGDGRASYADLSDTCGITESMARRRIEYLFTKAGVRPVTLVDPHLLGYNVEVLLWLRVDLAKLEDVASSLAACREVRYISATSGYSDLVCEVIMRSHDDLYAFMTGILGTLPGIRQVDIAAELVTLKRAYVQAE